jgi:hypothetical protein
VQLSKTVGGYAVNASVAWAGFTSNKTDMAVFHAAVVVPQSDIPAAIKLRRLPVLYPPDEVAIPRETGGESGSQLQIPGTETSIKLKREPKDFTQVALPLPCPSCGGSSQPDSEGTGASVCTGCGFVF